MASLHPDARALLESSALVHMTTLNRDGSPQTTVVWVGVEGEEIVSAHLMYSQKLRNVARDPRLSLSIEGTQINPIGLKEYLVVRGRARIVEGGAAPAPRARLSRPRGQVPADGRPAGGLRDADRGRARRRRRALGGVGGSRASRRSASAACGPG